MTDRDITARIEAKLDRLSKHVTPAQFVGLLIASIIATGIIIATT